MGLYGTDFYEVTIKRVTTTTETLAVFVRSNNEDSALEEAWAKAEFGAGTIVKTETETTLNDDDLVVTHISSAARAAEHCV